MEPLADLGATPRTGRGRIVARRVAGRTALAVFHAASPLRLVKPTFPGSASAVVCVVTFGGGLVDGDRIELDVVVEAGAALVLFTQASTKAFRGSSRQTLRARVHGTLVALPDPVAAFAGARYEQRIDVALHGPEACCVLLDGLTSGRPAYGERWAFDAVDLRTVIRHDDAIVLRDALRLDRDDGSIAARMGAFDALATLSAFGSAAATVAADVARGPSRDEDVVVAANELPCGGALARIAARSPERALAAARSRLRNLPEIGVVDPFASRH